MLQELPAILLILLLSGCTPNAQTGSHTSGHSSTSLHEVRRGFVTKIIAHDETPFPVPDPPPHLFRTVHYDSPAGQLAAYISQTTLDGKKHPAIIWIIGGFSNSIGETAWEVASPENDQSASAFWKAGIITMYPSMRGGNDNPGQKEGFYGEVDDVIAAARDLSEEPGVDPHRIYLGGHSTGGTLALLVAESCDLFRGVFSFGPVDEPTGYGANYLSFDSSNPRESELRSPIKWLDAIQNPTFVFEGSNAPSNLQSLQAMSQSCSNPMVHFMAVSNVNHYSILAPLTELIATKISKDNGQATNISFSDEEIRDAVIYQR